MADKVKGLKKLNKAITKQFAQFGIDNVEYTGEYSFIYVDNKITFKITENTVEDKWFAEYVKERFDYKVKYPFVFSILHEVGHAQANDDIYGEVHDFCMEEKDRIIAEMEEADAERSKELEWQYFNLPDEIMATAWAVKWCKANKKALKELNDNCIKALYKFYEKNSVVE